MSPTETDHHARRTALATAFIEALPFARALAMQVLDVGSGTATIAMEGDPRLVGDPATGVIHGGAVSALMDTACGAAVMARVERPETTATLDLRIDYMRPARPGDTIAATAECYHLTRSVAFVRAVATDGDADRPVATATGAFTVIARTEP